MERKILSVFPTFLTLVCKGNKTGDSCPKPNYFIFSLSTAKSIRTNQSGLQIVVLINKPVKQSLDYRCVLALTWTYSRFREEISRWRNLYLNKSQYWLRGAPNHVDTAKNEKAKWTDRPTN